MSELYQIRDRITGQFMSRSVCRCHPVWTTQALAEEFPADEAGRHAETLRSDTQHFCVPHIVPVGWTPAHDRETFREKIRNQIDALKKFFS